MMNGGQSYDCNTIRHELVFVALNLWMGQKREENLLGAIALIFSSFATGFCLALLVYGIR